MAWIGVHMKAGELCTRETVVAGQAESIEEAARLMREFHVGTLIVVEDTSDRSPPIGILTDRDIVVGAVAVGCDRLPLLRVGDVMSPNLVTAEEGEDLQPVLDRMRQQGVRRVPVVNSRGGLEGILSLDDVLDYLYREIKEVVETITKEQTREKNFRR